MSQGIDQHIRASAITLDDLTDFSAGNMNGWSVPAYSHPSEIITRSESAEQVLFGHSDQQFAGVVLTKQFTGLVVGEPYRLSYRGCKSANIANLPQNIPRLRVCAGDAVIVEDALLSRTNWNDFQGQFVANADTVKIDFVSVVEGLQQGYGNFCLDEIHVWGREDDVTQFNDGTLELWQPTAVTATARFERGRFDRGTVLRFETFGDDTEVNAGDAVIRTFAGLTPGKTYTFSVEAINNIGHPVRPILSLTHNGSELGSRFTPEVEVWATFSADFYLWAHGSPQR